MKTSVTFDTNVMIDLEESRSHSEAAGELVEAHVQGLIEVAFVAVSASERQPGDHYLETFEVFENRLAKLGLSHLPLIYGLAYFDLCYFDRALYAGEKCLQLERKIHERLFPRVSYKWADYAGEMQIESDERDSKYYKKWRNAWCDRQMIWAHLNAKRSIFISSDANFKSLSAAEPAIATSVKTPSEAVVELLR